MTLPVACPPPSNTSDLPSALPLRKRRRRAPASGASDDCFACTKRNIKCDRRRPYCSQCLEVGKECSGYKTQLTWGVGVASRGKLRGLSLPVARSAPAVKSPPTTPMSRPRAATNAAHKQKIEGDVKIKMESSLRNSPVPGNPYTTYDFVNMAPHGVASPTMDMHPQWNMGSQHDYPIPQDYQQDGMSNQRQLPQLHRLHTLSLSSLGGRGDGMGLSSSVDSLSTYAESDYASPISQSFPNDDIPYLHSPVPMYNSFSSRNSNADSPVAAMMSDSRGPTSCPDPYYAQSEMSSSISSHQNLYDIAESRQHQPSPSVGVFYDDEMMVGQRPPYDMEYGATTRPNHMGWTSVNSDEVASQASETDTYHITDRGHDRIAPSPIDVSPRTSFFLDYYEKIICPSVVVIDSPNNPYRENILSLATTSQSLQHAICALAACNLRMKRKQSLNQDHWRQKPIELELQDHVNGPHSRPSVTRRISTPLSPDPQSTDSSLQEEYQHRAMAVSLLNQQLSDPENARHDCVLATLFILCHYRMCESGIAQFRTQFAGVKKILGMRESGPQTGNWGWMETLFTYFDGIAASINDREAQLHGGFLDLIATPPNPNHGLVNLTGCDPSLFKIIGKLGRLNMMSQHRHVASEHSPLPARRPAPQPRPGLSGQDLADFYNSHAHNFDGNGFASTLDDDVAFHSLTSTSHDDLRTAFWGEWKAARLALQEWEFDAAHLVGSLPVTPSSTQIRDFGYIAESFRYSALLYTERLACPNLPSSHLNFQNLVSQVLFYVTSLEQGSGCEKFLLWPLFICGSECVNELQQSIVRTKCREIMARSGYLNNLAGLEVLEKLWTEKRDDGNGDDRKTGYGGPFKWTKLMDRSGGEWIMF